MYLLQGAPLVAVSNLKACLYFLFTGIFTINDADVHKDRTLHTDVFTFAVPASLCILNDGKWLPCGLRPHFCYTLIEVIEP